MNDASNRMSLAKLFAHIALLAVVILWVVPFIGLLTTSIRPQKDANETGFWRAFTPMERGHAVRTQGGPDGGSLLIEGNIFDDIAVAQQTRFERANERSANAFIPKEMEIVGDVTGILSIQRVPDPNDATKTIRQTVIQEPGEAFSVGKGEFTYQRDGRYTWRFDEAYSGKGKKLSVFIDQQPKFGWNSYVQVLTNVQVPNALISSFVVTIPATLIPIMIAAFAAYAFAWMRFPGRDLIFVVVVALLVVPLQLAFLPLLTSFTQAANWGTSLNQWLTDCEASNSCKVSSANFATLWIAHTAFGLPLAIYLLRNYVGNLPKEILESARMDGASHLQTFMKIIVPLSVPALASFGIFQFLWVWNDLLVALYLGPDGETSRVLPRIIQSQLGTYKSQLHLLNASAVISMIVPLIVFLSLQRYFVRGLLAGSVKGG